MIEDTTRMEGSRFNRVQVVVGSLTAKRIRRRKNHGIYTVRRKRGLMYEGVC